MACNVLGRASPNGVSPVDTTPLSSVAVVVVGVTSLDDVAAGVVSMNDVGCGESLVKDYLYNTYVSVWDWGECATGETYLDGES